MDDTQISFENLDEDQTEISEKLDYEKIKSLEIKLDPPGTSIEDKQSKTLFCNEFINFTPNNIFCFSNFN